MTSPHPPRRRASPSPLCLRVTAEEKQLLETFARTSGAPNVSTFLRTKLFADPVEPAQVPTSPSSARLSPVERQRLLAKLLRTLGETAPLRHLSDLASAARIGVLPLTPEVLADIRAACAAIQDMRRLLLQALGLRPPGPEDRDDPQG